MNLGGKDSELRLAATQGHMAWGGGGGGLSGASFKRWKVAGWKYTSQATVTKKQPLHP